MFNRITFLVMSVILLAGCEEEQRKVTPDMLHFPQSASGEQGSESLPQIEFERMEYQFDTIAIGEKLVYSFNFMNTGKSPLIIDQVRPSCGCTTLKDWPRDPIEPGKGGRISVEFNSTGFPGPIEKSIQVSTNGVPRDWYLKLRGYVSGQEKIVPLETPIEMERTR